MRIINKEQIEDIFKNKKNTSIYLSSSLKNLEYYEAILAKKGYKTSFLRLNTNDEIEMLDINIRLINLLKSKERQIIFIDFVLALSLFFTKYEKIQFNCGKDYSLNEIEEKLQQFGYKKEYFVQKQGEYSRRNDIIDIFSINMDNPVRLDFFDMEIEKIKIFDIETQKSFDKLEKVEVYSNIVKGTKALLTELCEDNIDIYLENEELLIHNLETMILLKQMSREELQKRYEILKNRSELLEVKLNSNRNYQSEIEIKREKKRKDLVKYRNISELQRGDYVIHVEYGIGKYDGLKMLENKEYLLIKYADEGELYVPVEKLYRIEKYINISNKEPELYRLGTKGFKKKQQKYKEEIEKVAKELIKIQAQREKQTGICFERDTSFQKEFEEKFEYLETRDQKQAIEDVKRDMESYKIMDRIICGDVGYGKTEVAMRAVFKAIESGYQVALLAPTTVLANQHYERFKKRFKDFPINISCYSRLSKDKKILDDLILGKIDLLIGTHKILSDKVEFNKLGLLVIDEEQKFGVKAKEKLKAKKTKIDVLTLTATPIPRTLNLALLGIRDISIISTPPLQKLPIKTKIYDKIEDVELKRIILEEIKRDGQIFYVSNNVKGMEEKKKYLENILPKFVGIEYINGQLNPKEIKEKIAAFENGEFQILLASTIIENGIDIPNANTIIIEDYDRLGLAQIYQLRGRVGRGKRQAYCYLINSKRITKKGEKKEESMNCVEDINSAGYLIAMEDMNIRGAGEILGNKQHGAIESFGYDLYIKLLNEEIKNQKEVKVKKIDVKLDIENKGYIPSDYIKESERIKLYKRILDINKQEELNEIEKEIEDRFGKIPEAFLLFLDNARIKVYCEQKGIERAYLEGENICFNLKTNVLKSNREEFLKEMRGKSYE